jgi:hypothetical protein
VVSQVVDMIETHLGKMTVKRGTGHNFLGMDINFNSNGMMKDYLTDAIAVFGGMHCAAATPAKKMYLRLKKTVMICPYQRGSFFTVLLPSCCTFQSADIWTSNLPWLFYALECLAAPAMIGENSNVCWNT